MRSIHFVGVLAVVGLLGFFLGRSSLVPPSPQLAATPLAGTGSGTVRVARVIDGDTIELEGGTRVRYIGINAPETVDPRKPVECFGVEASKKNRELVEGKSVRLKKDVSETDKYGRLLRYVWVGDPSTSSGQATFVNLELVREGYAAVSTYPPDVKYAGAFVEAEREAREAGSGLWGACGGTTSALPEVVGQEENGCTIKGNINASGEKIYHLPGCPYYERTKIDAARGERWFCTEAEAEAAGWRKAQNCP